MTLTRVKRNLLRVSSVIAVVVSQSNNRVALSHCRHSQSVVRRRQTVKSRSRRHITRLVSPHFTPRRSSRPSCGVRTDPVTTFSVLCHVFLATIRHFCGTCASVTLSLCSLSDDWTGRSNLPSNTRLSRRQLRGALRSVDADASGTCTMYFPRAHKIQRHLHPPRQLSGI